MATAIGILEGLPPLRNGLRNLLGRDRAQLAFGAVHAVSLTFAGSPLGLAVNGAGALQTADRGPRPPRRLARAMSNA